MRRVSIKTGLKQRLNEILGNADSPVDAITSWSIQAAMLSNLQRIVKGLTGDDDGDGRVMKGLQLATDSNRRVAKISLGVGFTPNGNVVTLASDIRYTIVSSDPLTSKTVHLYLNNILSIVEENSFNPEGKNTNFIDGSEPEEIVADDLATTAKSSLTDEIINQIIFESDNKITNPDKIYLGRFVYDGSGVPTAYNTTHVGFIT
jgi:hypothetical protein